VVDLDVGDSSGGSRQAAKADLTAGPDTHRIGVALPEPISIHGRVITGAGRAVAEAEVEFGLRDEHVLKPSISSVTRTIAEGAWGFEGLPQGSGLLIASAPGYLPALRGETLLENTRDAYYELVLANPGRIQGKVLGLREGAAAKVELLARSIPEEKSAAPEAVVQPSGEFSFDAVRPGIYRIWLEAGGPGPDAHSSRTARVQVRPIETAQVEFDLRGGVVLHGRVYLGEVPFAEADLTFRLKKRGTGWERTKSDGNGDYTVRLPEAGSYLVSMRKDPEFQGGSRLQVNVGGGDHPESDLHFSAGAIRGKVLDASGRAVPGARVNLILYSDEKANPITGKSEFARLSQADCREDGTFEILGLARGKYRLDVEAVGYADRLVDPIPLERDEQRSLGDIGLDSGDDLQVVAIGPNDQLLVGADVSATRNFEQGLSTSPSGTTGERGLVTIKNMNPDTYTLVGLFPGLAPAILENVVVSGGDSAGPVPLKLTRGGTLDIQILGNGGEPQSEERATIVDDQGRDFTFVSGEFLDGYGPELTDENGRSRLRGVRPGKYMVGIWGNEKVKPQSVVVTEGVITTVVLIVE